MIFLSHNSKDKGIVEPFANRLADVFGRDKIFYDSWSIQPGDGIIDKMEEGMKSAKYFFFFVSQNSLQSNMVKLEWQNAIVNATNGKIKFIPIKLDSSTMPALLTQTLYLDVHSNGFEVVLRQMIDVINGKNTYTGETRTYENVKAHIKRVDEKEIDVEFYAETYMEPISRYAIVIKNEESDIQWKCETDKVVLSGFNKDSVTVAGLYKYNALAISVQRATTPEFPVKVNVKSKTRLDFLCVMREKVEGKYEMIPFDVINA